MIKEAEGGRGSTRHPAHSVVRSRFAGRYRAQRAIPPTFRALTFDGTQSPHLADRLVGPFPVRSGFAATSALRTRCASEREIDEADRLNRFLTIVSSYSISMANVSCPALPVQADAEPPHVQISCY